MGERLSLRDGGKTAWESYGRQPDSGNPTVRDDKGGLRKRDARFAMPLATKLETMDILEAVNLPMRAPYFYPDFTGDAENRVCDALAL